MNELVVFENDTNKVFIEHINDNMFRLHAMSRFKRGYHKDILVGREEMLALRDFLNDFYKDE